MVLFSCQKEQNNPQPPEIIEIQPGAELGKDALVDIRNRNDNFGSIDDHHPAFLDSG